MRQAVAGSYPHTLHFPRSDSLRTACLWEIQSTVPGHSYKFKFDGIFGMESKQEEIFSTVAKESCNRCEPGGSCRTAPPHSQPPATPYLAGGLLLVPCAPSALEGFNATIFAYGQTGSGKTFTITGGGERYQDRGIIPRVLSHLFAEFQKVRLACHSPHAPLHPPRALSSPTSHPPICNADTMSNLL